MNTIKSFVISALLAAATLLVAGHAFPAQTSTVKQTPRFGGSLIQGSIVSPSMRVTAQFT